MPLIKKTENKAFQFTYRPRSPESIRERAAKTSGRDTYYKPEAALFTAPENLNTIRILPPPPDADWGHYGMTVWEHRDVGADGGSYLCLEKMLQKSCPVCEERVRADSSGEDDLAYELRPRQRTIFYLIDRKNEDKGPLVWNISAGHKKSMDTDLLNLCTDPTTGEALAVDDPHEGYDLSFVRKGKLLDTEYSGKQFARRPSPISDDPEKQEKWLKYIIEYSIDKLLLYHDYDYISKVLRGSSNDGKTQQNDVVNVVNEVVVAERKVVDTETTTTAPRKIKPRVPKAEPVEEEETKDNADLPTWDELLELDDSALEALGTEMNVVFPQDGFNDIDEFRSWLADQLGIEKPQPAKPPVSAKKPSWRDRFNKQTAGK